MAASTSAAGRASGTMTARSRSTVGWRDGAATRYAAGWPPARPGDRELADDDPLGAQVERVDDERMELAEPPDDRPAAATRAARPGWRFGSSAIGVKAGIGAPSRRHSSSTRPLRVVDVVRPGGSVGSGRQGRAGQREPEPPPLVGRAVVRGAVALADLEDRDIVAAVAEVGRDDLEEAPDEALAEHRVLARQRVGDGDRPARRTLLGLAVGRAVVARREPLDRGRGDEGERHDLGQAGAGERLAEHRPDGQRIGSVRRHRRVRERRRDEFVATDPDDLLGDVGLDEEVAPPGRDRRVDDLGVAGRDLERLRARRDDDPGPGSGRRRLDPDPRQQRPLLVRPEGRADEPVDPGGPERDVRGRRLGRRGVDRAGRDLATGPLGDQAGGPVGAEPREPPFLALLEAEARVRPERVAEGRPPDADRVEDGRLDDDLGRPLPDLGAGAAHDAGDADRAGRVGDEQRLGVEVADDVVERLEALAGGRPADDDPAVADRTPRRRCGSACRARP